MKLEVKRIGNSTGLILPKELLARLRLDKGDWVYVTELSDRSLKIAPYDPDHETAMEVAREVMKEYQDTFKALAK
ncbi:MAG: AbrB/MazE/SpoVT family DNA-binding domain-containing protein [Xanthobacteraceae bacterium]|jgi:putative addiction module antidote